MTDLTVQTTPTLSFPKFIPNAGEIPLVNNHGRRIGTCAFLPKKGVEPVADVFATRNPNLHLIADDYRPNCEEFNLDIINFVYHEVRIFQGLFSKHRTFSTFTNCSNDDPNARKFIYETLLDHITFDEGYAAFKNIMKTFLLKR